MKHSGGWAEVYWTAYRILDSGSRERLNFFLPAFNVNLEDFWESFLVVVCKAVCVQATVFWHETDWCVNCVVYAVAAVKNPCEDAAVVPENLTICKKILINQIRI